MKKIITACCVFALLAFTNARHEEGMFPLSYLSKLDLKKAGLKIDPKEIYDENEISLVNALVRLGGCTGSFISDQGLIITNHHCVYGTVASMSTPENNYLKNGFYAANSEDELKTSLPCKITESFIDVSAAVLEGVDGLDNALAKQKRIAENRKKLIEEESAKNPDRLIEISEMLVGKVYTMFRYMELNDVRIVYVPPKNIGKFGGETDNWEWPRHNGDFAIVRAYENGSPYGPDKHLEVNPAGTKEGDFTFILGYPGRTYRNQPAQYLEYQQDYILPIIASWFDFQINAIEEYAGDDVAKQLRYSGRLASLNNTSKNFKGKLQGLRRTDVMQAAKDKHQKMLEYAKSSKHFSSYIPLFENSDKLHEQKFSLITDVLYMGQMLRTSKLATAASGISLYHDAIDTLDKETRSLYLHDKKVKMDRYFMPYFNIGKEISLDEKLLAELVYQLGQSKLTSVKDALSMYAGKSREEVSAAISELMFKSELSDPENCRKVYEKNPERFLKLKDPLVDLIKRILPVYQSIQEEFGLVNAQIDEIIPRLNDIDMAMNGDNFVPDANSTLRFTFGYVKGYEPEDAVAYSPFTTINGILEKSVGSSNKDYYLEDELINKMKTIEPADVLKHPEHDAVVVGFLYNMDTTGGNSGSPILDAYGRIVGVNFDRAYSATINDYAWNESYSRSIGVDIRYVLYIMKYFGEADAVLSEMGVEL